MQELNAPGLPEAQAALVAEGLSDHYAEHLATLVLTAATSPILSAAFADAADQAADYATMAPGIGWEHTAAFADNISRTIREMTT